MTIFNVWLASAPKSIGVVHLWTRLSTTSLRLNKLQSGRCLENIHRKRFRSRCGRVTSSQAFRSLQRLPFGFQSEIAAAAARVALQRKLSGGAVRRKCEARIASTGVLVHYCAFFSQSTVKTQCTAGNGNDLLLRVVLIRSC